MPLPENTKPILRITITPIRYLDKIPYQNKTNKTHKLDLNKSLGIDDKTVIKYVTSIWNVFGIFISILKCPNRCMITEENVILYVKFLLLISDLYQTGS